MTSLLIQWPTDLKEFICISRRGVCVLGEGVPEPTQSHPGLGQGQAENEGNPKKARGRSGGLGGPPPGPRRRGSHPGGARLCSVTLALLWHLARSFQLLPPSSRSGPCVRGFSRHRQEDRGLLPPWPRLGASRTGWRVIFSFCEELPRPGRASLSLSLSLSAALCPTAWQGPGTQSCLWREGGRGEGRGALVACVLQWCEGTALPPRLSLKPLRRQRRKCWHFPPAK